MGDSVAAQHGDQMSLFLLSHAAFGREGVQVRIWGGGDSSLQNNYLAWWP